MRTYTFLAVQHPYWTLSWSTYLIPWLVWWNVGWRNTIRTFLSLCQLKAAFLHMKLVATLDSKSKCSNSYASSTCIIYSFTCTITILLLLLFSGHAPHDKSWEWKPGNGTITCMMSACHSSQLIVEHQTMYIFNNAPPSLSDSLLPPLSILQHHYESTNHTENSVHWLPPNSSYSSVVSLP